jgi:hypothetical protein
MRLNDSIAQLACALAKARVDILNPSKSLTGHLDGTGTALLAKATGYAPLTAGPAQSCHFRAVARVRNSTKTAKQRRWAMRTDCMRPSNEAPLFVCSLIERAPKRPGGFVGVS